jgi:hypothetical protein
MPAALPGSTAAANNTGNPAAGNMVLFSSFSGPKGSPLDKDAAGNASTGALSTGIGFGSPPVVGQLAGLTNAQSIRQAGFDDDETIGLSLPSGASATDSTLVAIGGGRSVIAGGLPGGLSSPSPYTAGFAILGAGNGGSRDAGAGPAFTGFEKKMVTASAGVANGAAVETGWINRSGVALVANQSVFGSATAASSAPA